MEGQMKYLILETLQQAPNINGYSGLVGVFGKIITFSERGDQ